jgi:hypothetical protein
MALFQRPNKMSALQAAQVNSYQRDLQKKDLLTLNKNLQYEESAFNKSLYDATTIADLPKGQLFASDAELIDFKNNHDPSTVGFDSYLKFYGQEEAMARVLNGSNAASAILGYGKTIDLDSTKWNPDTQSFDVMVRTEDQEKGQARTNPMTEAGTTVQGLLAEGGRAAVEENTLPGVGIDEVNFFLEQIKSQGQNAAGGFSALENIGGMDKKGANIDWFQRDTRKQLKTLAEIMAGTGTGAGAGTGTGTGTGTETETGTTTQMSGVITVDNIDSLGITTNIAISDRNIINKIIQVESGGKPDADSGHAKGLMQLKDSTADKPGLGVKPVVRSGPNGEISAEENVRFGTDYFDALTEKYDGDLVTAAMAYNAGTGAIDKWIEGGRKYEDLREETQNYVAKIFGEDVREQVKNGAYGQGDSTPAASTQVLGQDVIDSASGSSSESVERAPYKYYGNSTVLASAISTYKDKQALNEMLGPEFYLEPGFQFTDEQNKKLSNNEKKLIRQRLVKKSTENIEANINEVEKNTRKTALSIDNVAGATEEATAAAKDTSRFYNTNNKELKEIFAASPALYEEFQQDPEAFALKYKDNFESIAPKKVSTGDISKTIKDSPFKFTAADSKALYDGAKCGDVQTFANSLSTIIDKYVGVDGVPLAFQNAAVAILGSADNFIANSGQQRLDQHIISGMWATLDDDQRKTYAPYLMRFVETGRFSFEGITADNQTRNASVNERNVAVNESNAMKISDAGNNLNDIRDRMLEDGYVFNSNDISSAISYINQADIGGNLIDLQAGRDTIGVGMKQWVGSQKKGWWNSIVSNFPIFGTGGTGTPNAAFATQPDLLAYTEGGELVTRPDQEVGYFTRTAPGNPQIKLPQSKISAYWANNELAPEGLQYLTTLAIANSKVKAAKQGG